MLRTATVLAFSLILSCIGLAHAGNLVSSDYFTIEEYLSLHQRQKPLMEVFETVVRNPGERISFQQDRPLKIAVVYPGNQASDYWRRSVLSFKMRMKELGLSFSVSEFFSRPGSEVRMQAEHIREALASDPDYLVFTLDVGKHKQIIEQILTKKRPKIILQNITTPVRAWEGRQPFLYVGFDHTRGAKMLANHFLRQTGTEGKYGVLYFSKGYVSAMRGDCFIRHIETHSSKKLAGAHYTNGNRSKARQAALDILNKEQVDFIYACSTDIALGGMDALAETGKKSQVAINGWGGGSVELDAILKGDLDVTVMRINDDNGVAMAEAIRMDIEGYGKSVPTIYSGDMVLIEKGISPEKIMKLTSKAFRYSGQAGRH